MTVLDKLIEAIRETAVYNPEAQVAPFCILWPDKDYQWEAAIPLIQNEMPELLVLGKYNQSKRTGPAIWLRCVVSGMDSNTSLKDELIPIIYLPGVSRQELRAVGNCPDNLKAIAELQYRGVFWSQMNSKDWTILAFLISSLGGLNLDIPRDKETKKALLLALNRLLEEDVSQLEEKRLDKDFLNELASGKDVHKDLLLWMNDSKRFIYSRDNNAWRAFIGLCKSQFSFDPEAEGEIEASRLLANHDEHWITVWNRYREAPNRYQGIPSLIRKAQPPEFDLFSTVESTGGWPQWNESEEDSLCIELLKLNDLTSPLARERIIALEEIHGPRRGLVWAELEMAPLAMALKNLVHLANVTKHKLPSNTLKGLETAYCEDGWKADAAVLKTLSVSSDEKVFQAVSTAIQVIYTTWLEDAAKKLQKLVLDSSYPGKKGAQVLPKYDDGTCLVFVDGLRFDIAKMLKEKLEASGKEIEESLFWSTLPSITISGKAAVTPVASLIDGSGNPKEFEPGVADTNYSLKGGYHLKKLLEENGWQILKSHEVGNIKGRAWCEVGNFDHEGHDRGWKLALYFTDLIEEVKERVLALCDAGWKTVKVVSDHGWLLLPGGLPKEDLSSYLSDTKGSRYAALKLGTTTSQKLYPWTWDSTYDVALADGISCYRKGEEYQHGGLSLQECLTLQLIIYGGEESSDVFVGDLDCSWKGLRCNVVAKGDVFGLMVDIRMRAGLAESSVVYAKKSFDEEGRASVVVEDGDLEGKHATLLLIDVNGNAIYQIETTIGGII